MAKKRPCNAALLAMGATLLFSALAHAQSAGRTQRVDALFAGFNNQDSPGCALAVVQDGRIIYERCYGMANLDYNIPITPSSRFTIASTSKQFTAFSVALH